MKVGPRSARVSRKRRALVARMSAREGRSPDEVAYDYLTADAGNFLFFPVTGYARDDHEPIREMLTDSGTLLGLGDGGAHVAMIVDASAPTYMLTHWGRDRKRGPGLPLEYMVKRQTSETADFFGFHDRGRLQPGKRADINLIDFDRLRLHAPEVVNDLPAGGKRLVQRAEGYAATLVAGTPASSRESTPAPCPAASSVAGASGRLWRTGRTGAEKLAPFALQQRLDRMARSVDVYAAENIGRIR